MIVSGRVCHARLAHCRQPFIPICLRGRLPHGYLCVLSPVKELSNRYWDYSCNHSTVAIPDPGYRIKCKRLSDIDCCHGHFHVMQDRPPTKLTVDGSPPISQGRLGRWEIDSLHNVSGTLLPAFSYLAILHRQWVTQTANLLRSQHVGEATLSSSATNAHHYKSNIYRMRNTASDYRAAFTIPSLGLPAAPQRTRAYVIPRRS